MSKLKRWRLFIILIILSSCSGYRIKGRQNPFERLGIHTISVPTFINKSLFPHISGLMTSKVVNLLGQFPQLKVYPGESQKANAILLGIITDGGKMNTTFSVPSKQITAGAIKQSIGTRRDFYYPYTLYYKIFVQLVLIKNPNTMNPLEIEKDFLQGKIQDSKILFNEIIPLSGGHQTIQRGRNAQTDGVVVNYSQGLGVFDKKMEDLSNELGDRFKELILYVF